MSTALSQPRLISLAAGFTDQVTLPVEETRAIMEELLGSAKSGSVTLQYGTTLGDPILRELTASRLQLLDGNTALSSIATAERMIITNGSQQLLYMVTEALCDPGDIVLVEDPSYFVYLGILQSHGVRTKGVRMQPDGLDLAHLEELLTTLQREKQLHRLKLLYLVSYYQNPTGLTTSFEKKIGALKLLRRFERAAGHTLYLLEDAAYRELRFRGEDVKSALAIKGNHDFGSSNLLQQLLARALGSDLYERHLAVLRNRYAQKAKVTRKALQQHFPPSVRWREPEGGLYFWPRLPHPLTSGTRSRFFHEALRKEVLYVPGELCYADDRDRRKPNNEMRLSFGAASEGNLRAGIERLGQVLQKLLR